MKFPMNKPNLIFVACFLVFLVIVTALAFYRAPQLPKGSIYVCGNQGVPFRANISDCLGVSVSPSEKLLTEVLTSPATEGVLILLDPNGTADVGLSSYEIYKTFESLRLQSGIEAGVVYTEFWPDHPEVPVVGIENATYNVPVIWLLPDHYGTRIEVSGPQVFVYAKNQYDLDAAACKISILLINEYMDCG